MDIILGWNLYFRIILSILSRTEERIVESQDISGHLKRLIDFTIESKKLLNVLAITSFFRRISPFSLSIMLVSPLLCLFEKQGLHLSQKGLASFLQYMLLKYLNLVCLPLKQVFTLIKLNKVLLFMKCFKSPVEGSKLKSPIIT